MQILQWLIKVAHEPTKERNSSPTNKKNGEDQDAKSKNIVVYNHREAQRRQRGVEQNRLGSINFNILRISHRRDIARNCFYSTPNLKRVGSFNRRRWIHSIKMKKEDTARELGITHKAESTTHTWNKVLPVSDASLSSATNVTNQNGSTEKKDRAKGEKTKTISKMKELLRWAAATKSDKEGKYLRRKVLQFRNRASLKAIPDEDQLSNESPKISFRCDMQSCSTISSAISKSSTTKNDLMPSSSSSTPIHDRDQSIARKGKWITTDSEFVVLEL